MTMANIFARTLSVTVTGALVLSLSACMSAGPAKEDIVKAADVFAQALISRDTADIAELTVEGAGSEDYLADLLDTSGYTDNDAAFIDAVADTLTYKIDEDSFDAERDEASVDVVFVMADYEEVIEGGTYNGVDKALEELDACTGTKKVTVTFEFARTDGGWLISNIKSDEYSDIFAFYAQIPDIRDIPDLASLVTGSYTVSGPGYVELSAEFEENIQDYNDLLTCEVICDGETVETDGQVSCYQNLIWAGYYVDGDVPAGNYTINIYCQDELIVTDSEIVTEGAAGLSGLADPVNITGDNYIGEYDYTEVFADNYLYYEGYAVPLEGTLKTAMYMVIGDGLWKLTVHEDEFMEAAYEYLEENSTILMASYLEISIDQVDDYADEIGQDEFDELKAEVFDELIDGFFDGSETVDFGSYIYIGEKLSFSSSLGMSSDFTGEFDDEGVLTLDIGFDQIEFYPAE